MITKNLNPEDITDLKTYAECLLIGFISLKTLINTHIHVAGQPFIDTDQEERITHLVYSLRRVLGLYHEQLESVLELIPETEQELMDAIRKDIHL